MQFLRHDHIVRAGVTAVAQWRKLNPYSGMELGSANFDGLDLRGIDLIHAKLHGTSFVNANLSGARLNGSKAATSIEFSLPPNFGTKGGPTTIEFESYKVEKGDSLFGPNARVPNFSGANLDAADLSNVEYCGVLFEKANLASASLSHAKLDQCDFQSACMIESSLHWCILNQCKSSQADFERANFGGTNIVNSDLSECRGLQSAVHAFHSHISIDTILASGGKLPNEFLRGCGFPSWMQVVSDLCNPELNNSEIAELIKSRLQGSRVTGPICGIFLSYSHEDSSFVDRLEKRFVRTNVPTFRDVHDLTSGDIHRQVRQAIARQDVLLVVLSKSSLQSDWVWHEINLAREQERLLGKDVLCPIAIDDSWKNPSAYDLQVQYMLETHSVELTFLKKKMILDFNPNRISDKEFNQLFEGLRLYYTSSARD